MDEPGFPIFRLPLFTVVIFIIPLGHKLKIVAWRPTTRRPAKPTHLCKPHATFLFASPAASGMISAARLAACRRRRVTHEAMVDCHLHFRVDAVTGRSPGRLPGRGPRYAGPAHRRGTCCLYA